VYTGGVFTSRESKLRRYLARQRIVGEPFNERMYSPISGGGGALNHGSPLFMHSHSSLGGVMSVRATNCGSRHV
jgi:hypothetical protein